jgi:ABC-type nitrate/sulfonate/bicarbonate transport system substrate-binding protein
VGEKIMRVTRGSLTAALAATLFGTALLDTAVPISELPSILLEKKDLAKSLGKSYQLEVTRFGGTPLMITAMAAGELDIANLAYPSLPVAIQNAGMNDLRIIADSFQDGNAGYYSNEYMVLADGPIRKIEDLKGKVVATNVAGSGADIAMRAMLRKVGLENKRGYTVIEAPFPTMRAMLLEKKVDLVPAVLPFSHDPELRKIGRPLFTAADAVGVSQFTPQEIERLRLALAPLCPALGSVSAELKEAGLFRVQAERELCQAFLEIDQETLRILPVLESDDCVVGIPHDDHIAPCVAHAPLLDPEIVDVMEIHIRKQW